MLTQTQSGRGLQRIISIRDDGEAWVVWIALLAASSDGEATYNQGGGIARTIPVGIAA
jgi:hypothetical protein